MSLEALGNIGDFVGGVAVVVTLIYLAVQIRQNTRQVHQSVELARAASVKAANAVEPSLLAIAQDPELARIFREGLTDYSSVKGDDQLRFLATPGGREWWKRHGVQYSRVFEKFVDEEVLGEPGPPPAL